MPPFAKPQHKDGEDEQHPIKCFASEYDGFASRSNHATFASSVRDALHTASHEPRPSWKQTWDIESASTACSTQDSLPSLTFTRLHAHLRQTTERRIPAIAKPARWHTIDDGQRSIGHRWPVMCYDGNMEESDRSERDTYDFDDDDDDDASIDPDGSIDSDRPTIRDTDDEYD